MTKKNNKIIKMNFGGQQKDENINNGLLDYFGFNKKDKSKTIFPIVMMPFDLSAKTSIIFERDFYVWMLMDKLKGKKNQRVNNFTLQSILCYDADQLLEENQFDLFVPDKVQECENILFLGNLDLQGIKEFVLLKQQKALRNIQPWISMYELMIERAKNNQENTFDLKKEIRSDELKAFSRYFEPEIKNKIKQILKMERKGISEQILKLEDFD